MSITYEEALATLTSMFAAPWTEDSLDSVLRHFEGHMENTVDAVLSHGDADPSELVKRLESSQAGATIEDMDEALARQLSNAEERGNTTNAGGGMTPRDGNTYPAQPTARPPQIPGQTPAPASQKGRGTATALPPDFLRIPGSPAQISNDEQLARMLQDKLFAEEIKNNPEFAHLARGRGGGRTGSNAGMGLPGSSMRRPQGTGEPPEVLKALQGMGEQAKRRFQDLAQKFKNRMEQSQNQQTPGAGYNQIGVAERRGLLDIHEDEDEQEISFVGNGGSNSRNADYEMKSMDPGFAIGGKKQD